MKKLFFISIGALSCSFITAMDQPTSPSKTVLTPPTPLVNQSNQADQKILDLVAGYHLRSTEIQKYLLAYSDPGQVMDLLGNLETMLKEGGHKTHNAEIKAAAKVAYKLAKIEAQTACAQAIQCQLQDPTRYNLAIAIAERYKAKYLTAAINSQYVNVFEELTERK